MLNNYVFMEGKRVSRRAKGGEASKEYLPNLDSQRRSLSGDQLSIERCYPNPVGTAFPCKLLTCEGPIGKQGKGFESRVSRALQSYFPRSPQCQPGLGVCCPCVLEISRGGTTHSHLVSFVVRKFCLNQGKKPDWVACVHFL